ncbi:acyl-CoA N-acyltransferase [Thozetella sp. PMI_491]|nr:acyl-CoA N-acyltransferase [Thozetella sp. PMI_491]
MSTPPQPRFTVRLAQVSEASSIAKLGAHVFTVNAGDSLEQHELDDFIANSYTTTAVVKDLEDSARDIVVATDMDGQIIGFAYLRRQSSEPCIDDVPSKAELQRLYVHPLAQGKGVGRSLVTRVEGMAREQGFANMWLGVWQKNTRAITAYENWGYRLVGTHDFVIGPRTNTDNVMLKSL